MKILIPVDGSAHAGRGAFDALVPGSVAMRVAAGCDKPLLLIWET